MKIRDIVDLVTLGILWGASFLLIRIAVPEFGSFALMEVRVAVAAAILIPLVMARRELPEILAHWKPIAVIGLVHYAIPFSLYAFAMHTLSAGYSSIINAAAPLFAAFVARVWLGESLGGSRLTGSVLGFVGVAVMVWPKTASGAGINTLPVAATVTAAACYGFSAVLAKRWVADVSPLAVAGGSMATAGLALFPLAVLFWPTSSPSLEAWGIVSVLGAVCTALAFVLYFRLIASAGPSRAITVTFLIPVFAVLFGIAFIGEALTATMIVGGLAIAFGTVLATGLLKLQRHARSVATATARLGIVVVTCSALIGAPEDAHPADIELAVPVFLSANVFALRDTDGWDHFETLAASGELVVSKARSRWSASLFSEYHVSDDKRVDGTILTGLQLNRARANWQTSAFWFASRFPGEASRATVMGRTRYAFAHGQRVGMEYLAYTNNVEGGELKLGYYGTASGGVSFKLLLGSTVTSGWSPIARLQFSWRVW